MTNESQPTNTTTTTNEEQRQNRKFFLSSTVNHIATGYQNLCVVLCLCSVSAENNKDERTNERNDS